jgi:predicted AlkP superfamily pyrophosphatase or phosphodiesterase
MTLSIFLVFFSSYFAIAKKPDRFVVLMFDQMRPDYVERYNLKNFKRLQKMGTNYPNALVGHSSSVTIVSHLVLATGLKPKSLPWADSFMVDRAGLLGKKDEVYLTPAFSLSEMMTLFKSIPADQWVGKRYKNKYDKNVYSVGQKHYATIDMGGPNADAIITLENQKGTCKPAGLKVPDYITSNNRYELNCNNRYGTEKSFYPLDGHRFYPGTDKDHLGGDIWVADVALDIMKHDANWGALFLTFGAIDKFGHMLGEPDFPIPLSFTPPMNLKEICQVADTQLGRLLDQLQKDGLLDKTLLISTADHGAQTDSYYMGDGKGNAIGIKKHAESKENDYSFWIMRLYQAGKIKLSSQDTMLRLWLEDQSDENKIPILNVLKEISKVTRIFELNKKEDKFYYKEIFNNLAREPKEFQKWALAHDEELLDTMANSAAPFYVALLADNAGFGKLGDHGGNQEKVQRIPFIIAGSNIKKGSDKKAMRLIDVEKVITKELELPLGPVKE